jgi:hypothetical protein
MKECRRTGARHVESNVSTFLCAAGEGGQVPTKYVDARLPTVLHVARGGRTGSHHVEPGLPTVLHATGGGGQVPTK